MTDDDWQAVDIEPEDLPDSDGARVGAVDRYDVLFVLACLLSAGILLGAFLAVIRGV